MATTPNYGWVTPAPTDFVTDLPADFEVFADAVDASFTASEGDLLVGGATNIFSPLTIGANATVLTSNGTTATWAAPAAAGTKEWDLVASGTIANGSSALNLTGLTGKDSYRLIVSGVRASGTGGQYRLRINNDTGSNYNFYGFRVTSTPTLEKDGDSGTTYAIISTGTDSSNSTEFIFDISGCLSTTEHKLWNAEGFIYGTSIRGFTHSGVYMSNSAITELNWLITSATFTQGSYKLYGSA